MAEQLLAPRNATAAKYRFRSRLDGAYYGIRMLYNTRGRYWTISMSNSEGDQILDGIKLVEGQDLIAQFKDTRLPPGQLIVDDTAGLDLDPGRYDLGRRVRIVYVEEADLGGAT